MRKYILFLIVLLISIAAVSAAEYKVEIKPIKDSILQNETAQFYATIENMASKRLEIEVYSPDVTWNVPLQTAEVKAKDESNILISARPTKYIGPNIYAVVLNFREKEGGEVVKETMNIELRQPGKAVSSYLPAVSMKIEMPDSIDPRKEARARITLENQNTLELKDVTLKITCEISAFEVEQKMDIDPLGKKIVELTYTLDPLQEPGRYPIIFELIKDNEAIEKSATQVDITTITPEFKEVSSVKNKKFLKSVEEKIFTSSSNIANTQTIRVPVNLISRFFISTEPDSKTMSDEEGRYYAVELTLNPGETQNVYITTNYRYITAVAAALIIILIMYFLFRSPIKIKKGVVNVQMKEGGISDIKVVLEVKSIAKTPLKNITIVDYIPNIADLDRGFVEGKLKPDKMLKHHKKGTILKWHLAEIAAGEERIISYDLKSKLSILGDFKLPRAKVIYIVKGKEKHVYSNSIGVSA